MELNIIDEDDNIGNRSLDWSNILYNSSNNEIQKFTEAKFFLSVKSLEYTPFHFHVSKTIGLNFKYVCDIEIMNECTSFHLFKPSPINTEKSNTNESSGFINKEIFSLIPRKKKKNFYSWDIGHYYGEIKVKITVKRVTNFLKCKTLGIKIMKLSDFLDMQNKSNSNHYWPIELKVPILIPLDHKKSIQQVHNIRKDNNHSNNNNGGVASSWFNKTAAYATGLSASTFYNNANPDILINSSTSSLKTEHIACSLCFEFRLVMLNHCQNLVFCCHQDRIMEKLIDFNTPHTLVYNENYCTTHQNSIHRVNELHLLIATAPSEVVVAVLKQLAMKNILMRCLSTRTSNNFTPFDIALINGRDHIVREMLSRCGNVCFQNIAVNTSSPIHNAVIGGSVLCMEYLLSFLGKYCTREMPIIGVQNDLWLSNLQVQLEWMDEHGNTALSLACMLPNRYLVIKQLLSKKADPCSVNPITKSTPLLNACQLGDVEIVSLLIHCTKCRADIIKNIYGLDSLKEIRKSALYKHIQINSTSRNLLFSNNRDSGGYFNIISVFLCNPKHCDIYGRQAIHIAAEYSHNEVLMIMLRLYINSNNKYDFVDTTDLAGNNLFHILAKHGNIRFIKKLIEIETDYWIIPTNNNNNNNNNNEQRRRMHLLVRNSSGKLPVDLCFESGHVLLSLILMQEILKLYNFKVFTQDIFLIQHLIYIQELIISKLTTITTTSTSSFSCCYYCQEPNQFSNRSSPPCCCDVDIYKDSAMNILSTLHQLKVDNHLLTQTTTTTTIKGDNANNEVTKEESLLLIDDFADAFEYSLALSPLTLSKFK